MVKACLLFCTALLAAVPTWAQTTTYWGGFEDIVGGDYDYNDLVFSLTGTSLNLMQSGGIYSSKPVLNTVGSGTPFWNGASGDGLDDNVGYCIYVGCNGSAALAPTDTYLATSSGASVTGVSFSVMGKVNETITLHIAADNDSLGWYDLSNPRVIHTLAMGTNSFNPGGNFALVGLNAPTGQDFTSDALAAPTGVNLVTDPKGSHFAFFGPAAAVPEPSSIMLFGTILLGAVALLRRKSSDL